MSDDLKKNYEKAEPPGYRDHGGRSEVFRKIRDVEAWARAERLKVANEIVQSRETWLNEERRKETLARNTPSLDLTPPAQKKTIEQVARERVSLKIQGLMAAIETERNRRIEDITHLPHATHLQKTKGHLISPQLRTENKPPSEIGSNAIQTRAQQTRINARTHFNRMRPLFIADAQASGSNTPVKDVYDNYQKRMARIDSAENNLLAETLKDSFQRQSPSRNQGGPGMS